uniref:Tetraspanin n=1 Tax=Ornithodoros turicata TaxID=34597 RepID=A0A2R5LCA7_9ACAR
MGYRWLRFTLITTNVVVWLLGLSLLVAGCLLIVDQDVKEVTHNFDIFDNYRVAGVFTIVVGTCLSCVGFLGCCGALFLNGCLLLTYIMLMAVFLVLEFTVMGLVWKHANVYELEENVSEAFRKLILKSRNGIFAVEMFLDRVQQDLKCCGGHGPDDYILLEMDCSAGCFYYTSGEVVTYSQGCGKAVSDFLMGKSLAIGLVCLFIILIQLFAVGCAVYLYLDQRNKKPTPV